MVIFSMLCEIPFRMLFLDEFIFFRPFRLFDCQQHDADRKKHQCGDKDEERLIIHVVEFFCLRFRIHQSREDQVEDAAKRTHKINDCISAGAQGLRGNIRHQGYGR